MKIRKLQTGDIVQELDKAVTLEVYTRCPEKYKLTDMETGEEYVGYASEGKNSWRKLNTD
jgi:hypothetical protein